MSPRSTCSRVLDRTPFPPSPAMRLHPRPGRPAKNPPPRWLKAIGLATVVSATAAAGAAIAYPLPVAGLCPSCLGFEKASDRLYVEDGMAPRERAAALPTIAAARDRLRGFYGAAQSDPAIFICGDDNCYRGIGGGRSRGMALLSLALF